VQRHGISRQLQRTASGSTPHDRVTGLQICSSCPLPLDRPRQSTPRYPPALANRQTRYGVRRHPPLIRQPLHRRTTRCIGSIPTSQLARGTQIPIAPAALPDVPSSAVSSLGGFRTPAAEYAAPSLKRPASETLHNSRLARPITWLASKSRRPHPHRGDERSASVDPPQLSEGAFDRCHSSLERNWPRRAQSIFTHHRG
jgi:hypothetical protein